MIWTKANGKALQIGVRYNPLPCLLETHLASSSPHILGTMQVLPNFERLTFTRSGQSCTCQFVVTAASASALRPSFLECIEGDREYNGVFILGLCPVPQHLQHGMCMC